VRRRKRLREICLLFPCACFRSLSLKGRKHQHCIVPAGAIHAVIILSFARYVGMICTDSSIFWNQHDFHFLNTPAWKGCVAREIVLFLFQLLPILYIWVVSCSTFPVVCLCLFLSVFFFCETFASVSTPAIKILSIVFVRFQTVFCRTLGLINIKLHRIFETTTSRCLR